MIVPEISKNVDENYILTLDCNGFKYNFPFTILELHDLRTEIENITTICKKFKVEDK